MPSKKSSLDIEKGSFALDVFEYRFGQVGYWVIFLLLLIALFGGFGSGLLQPTTVRDETQGLIIKYNNFLRDGDAATVNLELTKFSNPNAVNIWISENYLSKFEIRSIIPEPSENTFSNGYVIFTFPIKPNTSNFKAMFLIEPNHWGSISGKIGTDPDHLLAIKHFIYP